MHGNRLSHLASTSRHGWGWQIVLEAIPALSIFVLLLIALIPMRLPASWAAGGLWPLLGLFYWSLVQPRLVPVLLIFVIGLLCDLALNMALGCHGLIFILLHVVVTTQRRFLIGQGFWLVWPAFALSVITVYSLIFVLQHVVTATAFSTQDWEAGLPAVFIVMLAFPVLLPVLHGLQRLVAHSV
jgi:rod shape-determining protein MreD